MPLHQRRESESPSLKHDSQTHFSIPNRGIPFVVCHLNGRNIALADYITRKFHEVITQSAFDVEDERQSWNQPSGGAFRIDSPGQQVLQRSSVLANADWVEARISISLPARGRTILGMKAQNIFTTSLPFVVQNALLFSAYDSNDVEAFVACIEDQDFLRNAIVEQGT
jgi:predicted ABC-class ATPase